MTLPLLPWSRPKWNGPLFTMKMRAIVLMLQLSLMLLLGLCLISRDNSKKFKGVVTTLDATNTTTWEFCLLWAIWYLQSGKWNFLCLHTKIRTKIPKNWELGDLGDGCVRRVSTMWWWRKGKFLVMSSRRFPKNSQSLAATTDEECELACLSNCACNASAFDNRCLIWTGDRSYLQQL